MLPTCNDEEKETKPNTKQRGNLFHLFLINWQTVYAGFWKKVSINKESQWKMLSTVPAPTGQKNKRKNKRYFLCNAGKMPSCNSKEKLFTSCAVCSQMSNNLRFIFMVNKYLWGACTRIWCWTPFGTFLTSSCPPFHSLPSSLLTSFQSHQVRVNVTPPAGFLFYP